MSSEYLLTAFVAVIIVGMIVCWIAYQIGRLQGYHYGLEKGTQSASQTQHLRGMADGYVMSIQHTPQQRDEYMNNVLLKIGAVTPADIEADRQRRLQLQVEG